MDTLFGLGEIDLSVSYTLHYKDGTVHAVSHKTCYSSLFFSSSEKEIDHIIDHKQGIIPEWAEFVINNERWSDVFTNKDVEDQAKNGFYVNAHCNPVLLNWALTSLRGGHEHKQRINRLTEILRKNFSDVSMWEIYILATYLMYGNGKFTTNPLNGHWYMKDISEKILNNSVKFPKIKNFSEGGRMRHGELFNSLGEGTLRYPFPNTQSLTYDNLFNLHYTEKTFTTEEILEITKKNIDWIRSYN